VVAALGAAAEHVRSEDDPAETVAAETVAVEQNVLETEGTGWHVTGSQVSPTPRPVRLASCGSQVSSGSTTPSPHHRG
jgi:hypothetical protein